MAEAKLSKEAEQIMELVSKMSVLELSQLVKAMEEKFGVKAQAAVAVATATSVAAPVEEKDSFDVILTDVGSTKINVIKAVKNITGLGLAEAKALVDSAPKPIKEGVKKEEAEKIKKEIEDAGGKVELK